MAGYHVQRGSADGGAIYSEDNSLTISDSTFDGNLAQGGLAAPSIFGEGAIASVAPCRTSRASGFSTASQRPAP